MRQAVVLGGGIAGLAAAIALARAGWRVTVHEQATAIEPLGAALSLWPNATAALDQLGILAPMEASGAPLRSMLVADQGGRPIIGPRQVRGTALMVTRSALQGCLIDALGSTPLHLGSTVARVEQDRVGALVRFVGGRTVTADLVIDAGGIWSTIAGAPERKRPEFRQYGGVVALTDPVDGPGLDGAASEYWGSGERFGVFELPERCRYWFYMQDQRKGQAAPDHAYIAGRASEWVPAVADAVAATAPDRLTPFVIHAKPVPKELGRGRIISVGDAAHAMEPNLGQGACQALEDAVALGVVARDTSPDRILAAFEKLRLERVRPIVRRSAEGRTGAHGPGPIRAVMRAVLRALPVSVTDRVAEAVHTMPDYRCV